MLWGEIMSGVAGSKDINRGHCAGRRMETAGRTPRIAMGSDTGAWAMKRSEFTGITKDGAENEGRPVRRWLAGMRHFAPAQGQPWVFRGSRFCSYIEIPKTARAKLWESVFSRCHTCNGQGSMSSYARELRYRWLTEYMATLFVTSISFFGSY